MSFEQMMNRMDQLAVLGVLPSPIGDKVNVKITDEFFNIFTEKWEESFDKHDLEFNSRLQGMSGVALKILHPELSLEDLFELSKVCMFIWIKFYNTTAERYEKFLNFSELDYNGRGQ